MRSLNNNFEIRKGALIKYTGADSEVIIPGNVKAIGYYAFEDCFKKRCYR